MRLWSLLLLAAIALLATPERRTPEPTPVVVEKPKLRSKDGVYGYNSEVYNATFDRGKIEVDAPVSYSDIGRPKIAYELLSIDAGATRIASQSDIEPVYSEKGMDYLHGTVTERYVIRDLDVEQFFLLHELPERGDVVIRGRLDTNLESPADGTSGNELVFTKDGDPVMKIADCVAFDADDKRIRLELVYSEGQLTIRVPGEWIAAATLPITVDPSIGPVLDLATSTGDLWPDWRGGLFFTGSSGDLISRPIAVAHNTAADEYLVVWTEQFGTSTFDWDIFAQRVSSSGSLLGLPITVANSGAGEYECAVDFAPGTNRYMIVWSHDPTNDGSFADERISGKVLSSTGSTVVSTFTVADETDADFLPDITFDGSQFYVAWTQRFSSSDYDVRGRFVTTSGVPQAYSSVDTDADFAWRPSVDFLPGSSPQIMVAWEKGATSSSNFNIAGRAVSPGGPPSTSIFTVDASSSLNRFADVAAAGSQYLIVWQQHTASTNRDIIGRIVNSNGTFATGPLSIQNNSYDTLYPSVVWSVPNITYNVAYSSNQGGNYDVRARRVSSGGTVLDSTSGLGVSSAPEADFFPVQAGADPLLIAWGNWSIPSWTIQARRFSLDTVAPSVPSPLTPTGYHNDPTPFLDWSTSTDVGSGVMEYDVQVYAGATFATSTLIYFQTTASSSHTLTSSLSQGQHWWRVRARDNAFNESAWSGPVSLIIDTVGPGAPSLLSPADGSFTGDSTPTFDWTTATDPAGIQNYNIQIDNSGPTFPSPEVSATPSSSIYTSATLAEGTYHWRVRARDNAGNYGSYSSSFTLVVDGTPPSAPTLVSPADGAVMTSTPTLDWSDVVDVSGVSYDLEIDAASAATGLVPSSYSPAPLAEGSHTWRVRAVDGLGNVGAWSITRTFMIDSGPPAAPALLSPIGGIFAPATPVLDWSDVTDPTGVTYTIEIDDDSLFGSINVSLSGSTSSATPPALTDGTWFWRVRATDGAGNVGPDSTTESFMVDSSAPAAPGLISPASGTTSSDNTPTFDWSDVVDPSGVTYELEVDDDPAFGSPVVDVSVAASTYTAPAIPDNTYSWRVRAVDGAGNIGPWSAVFTLILDGQPPAAPTLLSPSGSISDATPTFDWTDVIDTGITYEIEINGATAASGLTLSEFTSTALAEGSYTWRVRATDGGGNVGPWSSTMSFTLDTTPPAAPVLLAPTGIVGSTVSFDWTDTGLTYEIQAAAALTGFAAPEVDTTVGASDHIAVLSGGDKEWRVRALDSAGNISPWSLIGTFTVNATPPAAPVLVSPADGATVTVSPAVFTWNASGTISYFDFELIGSVTAGPTATSISLTIADGAYQWRVRAVDTLGNTSAWSATFSVTLAAGNEANPPTVPVLVSPADASTVPSADLDWQDSTDDTAVDHYAVEIDDAGTFGAPLVSISSAVSQVSVPLPAGTFFWRVRAVDVFGNASGWSPTWAFTINDVTPPIAPIPLSPAANVTVVVNPVDFAWTSVSDPSGVIYEIDVAGLTPSASTTISLSLADANHTWRVRAIDGAGNVGPWSASVPFVKNSAAVPDTTPPGAPTLLSPADGSTVAAAQAAMSWTGVSDTSGIAYYEVELDGGSLVALGTSLLSGPLTNGAHSWRVRAYDGVGNAGAWSTTFTFTIDATLDTNGPSIPVLVSPANGAVLPVAPISLTWQPSIDASGISHYEFQIGTATFVSPVRSGVETGTSALVAPLGVGGYFWRVRAVDNAGNAGAWSASQSFEVRIAAPPSGSKGRTSTSCSATTAGAFSGWAILLVLLLLTARGLTRRQTAGG